MIKEEIKSFLANRRISQAVVAQVTGAYHQLHLHSKQGYEIATKKGNNISPPLTPPPLLPSGISQSRISHWLLQQGSDLSEQKKRAFFRWYQLEKTNPGNTSLLHHAHVYHNKLLRACTTGPAVVSLCRLS